MSQEKTPDSDQHRGSTVTFRMVTIRTKPDTICRDTIIGFLLDDRAPYSAIGLTEFKMLQAVLLSSCNGDFDPIPSHIADQP